MAIEYDVHGVKCKGKQDFCWLMILAKLMKFLETTPGRDDDDDPLKNKVALLLLESNNEKVFMMYLKKDERKE